MLEKMGWSKGKGLGANLDGERNFIRVSLKTDQKGMGYQDRDDQWTIHENQFNSLLKSLDDSKNVSADECASHDEEVEYRGFGFGSSTSQIDNVHKKSKSVKASLSGKSLEEMSKKSNARVHYRKFTRGKDISRYSEQDLANIFGKKHMNNDEESTASIEKKEIENSTNIEESAVDIGIKIVETGTTINDYFKKKKDAKSKRAKNEEFTASEHVENVDVESDTKRRKKSEQAYSVFESTADANVMASEKQQKKKDKKERKDKKEKEYSTICVEENDIEKKVECINVDADTDQASKRSKKQKRAKKAKENDCNMASVTEVEVNERVSKSNTNFVETILTALVNVNDSSNSSSTVLIQPDGDDDADSIKDDTNPLNNVINKSETHIYEINQFQAEIFRFVDLNGFPNANLSNICGYGVAGSIDLKVTEKTRDRTKINDLWDDALVNKYGKDVIQAKKKKRYSIKALNKRKLFTGL